MIFFYERSFDELKRGEKDIIQCVNLLTEYQETGMVKYRRCQNLESCMVRLGKAMCECFLMTRNVVVLPIPQLRNTRSYFSFFLAF